MRIIFEFTRVFIRPENNRGIDRVIRNVGFNLHQLQDVECIPVIQRDSIYYNARTVASPGAYQDQISRIYLLLRYIVQKIRYWHDSLHSKRIFKEIRFFRQLLNLVYKIAYKPIAFCTKICSAVRIKNTLRSLKVIELQQGDVLVWPNPFWDEGALKRLRHLKAQGVSIVIIIYDLFPITQSDWFRKNNSGKTSLLEIADGFMAISKTVQEELQAYMQKKLAFRADSVWYDYFYLGAELDRVVADIAPRPALQQLLAEQSSIYLMVGAIQPHKNHVYVLDAFENLWKNKKDVTLCIIGKAALKSSRVIERIKKHPQWGKRLFMWNDANDTELKSCYQHAKALIFPSLNEGFGLPLIEAMQHHLPVMASDIPIFREIGRDFVAYFDLNNPVELSRLVEEYEKNACFPGGKSVDEWEWLNWEESTQQLMGKIYQHQSALEQQHAEHCVAGR